MKTASVKEIKQELSTRSYDELKVLCLSLSKFKKENKELLTYLLFEADHEGDYILSVKEEITNEFKQINMSSVYFVSKSVRKILRLTKKQIRYSKKKPTEIELLLHFCIELKSLKPFYQKSTVLQNIYQKQVEMINKAIPKLHEDLQFDYQLELENL